MAVARLGTAEPTIGTDWLLASFAAPVIGGAVLSGGHVSVVGTMIAVILIVLLENGLLLARTDPYYVEFFLGCLILAAVGFNRWRAIQADKKGRGGYGRKGGRMSRSALLVEQAEKSFPGVKALDNVGAGSEIRRNPRPFGRERSREKHSY